MEAQTITKERIVEVNNLFELVTMGPGKLVNVKVVDPISDIVRREQIMMMYKYTPKDDTVELINVEDARRYQTYFADLVYTKQCRFENGIVVYDTTNSHWSYNDREGLNYSRMKNL